MLSLFRFFRAEDVANNFVAASEFLVLRQVAEPFPVSFLVDSEMFRHEVEEGAGDERDAAAVAGIVVGTVDVEGEAAHIAEQDNETASIDQRVQQIEVRLDDTGAEGLRGLLIAMMPLLLAQHSGSDALDGIEQVKQGIAEKLAEDERTDDKAEFATVQTLYLRRVGNGACFKTVGGGIENGSGAFYRKVLPGLARDESLETGADASRQVALQKTHFAAERRRRQFSASLLHSGKIEVGQHDLVGGASEVG